VQNFECAQDVGGRSGFERLGKNEIAVVVVPVEDHEGLVVVAGGGDELSGLIGKNLFHRLHECFETMMSFVFDWSWMEPSGILAGSLARGAIRVGG
jgi:hypothetical protein